VVGGRARWAIPIAAAIGLLLSMGMAGHCETGAPAKRAGAGGGIETRSGLEPAPTAVLLGTRG
jgi:hypothetical protein